MEFIYSLINMLAEMAPYLLLGFLVAGVLYAFVPGEFYRKHLSRPGAWAVIKAALIGVPLPLCSCGVLPTAVSLRRNGASRGASTSFLIATPQTGIDSIAATYPLLGPAFAIIRPVAALVTAFIGGMLVNREDTSCDVTADKEVDTIDAPASDSFIGKIRDALRYGFVEMVQNIGKWLIIGLVIAATITVFVPDGFFTFFADYPLLSMIAVVIVAVPMYVCSTGSIPIALSPDAERTKSGCGIRAADGGSCRQFRVNHNSQQIPRQEGSRNVSCHNRNGSHSNRLMHRLSHARRLVSDADDSRKDELPPSGRIVPPASVPCCS